MWCLSGHNALVCSLIRYDRMHSHGHLLPVVVVVSVLQWTLFLATSHIYHWQLQLSLYFTLMVQFFLLNRRHCQGYNADGLSFSHSKSVFIDSGLQWMCRRLMSRKCALSHWLISRVASLSLILTTFDAIDHTLWSIWGEVDLWNTGAPCTI